MPRFLRRLSRLVTLTGRWLTFVWRADDKRAALGDFRRWLSTTVGRYDLLGSAMPWITFEARRFLDVEVQSGWRVFEWGSGGSTAYFHRRGCAVVSVEHDPAWYRRVSSALAGRSEVDLLLVPRDHPGPDAGDDDRGFAAYCAAIERHPDDSLDLVLVDGRARGRCLAQAGAKVRSGGWVLLDDSERENYESFFDLFPADRWEVHHFSGPRPATIWPVFGRTTAFRKRAPATGGIRAAESGAFATGPPSPSGEAPRIAFVTNFCPHYRVGTFTELAARMDVEFLFFSRGGESYWGEGLEVHGGDFPHSYLDGWQVAGTRITPSLPLRLARGGFQAVCKCINGRFALPATYLTARLKGIPFILWTGVWHRLESPVHRLAFPLTRWIYRHADAVVVYGSHVERFLVAHGVEPSRVFIAPHAIDNRAYRRPVGAVERDAVRRSLGVGEGDRLVLFVGRLEPEKGLAHLIDAVASLERPGVVLALAGSGSQRQALREQAERAGLADRVRFTGTVPPTDLVPFYAAAEVLVLPSVTTATFKEPWGLVINEAFNQGLPAIATAAVGAAAGGLVEDGVTGFVVPERDSVALASALARLLDDASLRTTLGAQARQRVAAWNDRRMVDGFVAAIEFALRRRGR